MPTTHDSSSALNMTGSDVLYIGPLMKSWSCFTVTARYDQIRWLGMVSIKLSHTHKHNFTMHISSSIQSGTSIYSKHPTFDSITVSAVVFTTKTCSNCSDISHATPPMGRYRRNSPATHPSFYPDKTIIDAFVRQVPSGLNVPFGLE